jgi:hypothetical protein
MKDYDVCKCNHARVIHKPACNGAYAYDEWETPNVDRRHNCNCKKFVLDYEEREPDKCPCCGRVLEDWDID